ncbi:poly(ADP-ribose) polymerase catalytic domain-containing protein, partial [Toxoplasma gondii p89]
WQALRWDDVIKVAAKFGGRVKENHPLVQEHKRRSEGMWNLIDALKEVPKKQLLAILDANEIFYNEKKISALEAAQIIADGVLFGRLPKCPLCDTRALIQDGTDIRCRGYMQNSAMRCSFLFSLADLLRPENPPDNSATGVAESALSRTELFNLPFFGLLSLCLCYRSRLSACRSFVSGSPRKTFLARSSSAILSVRNEENCVFFSSRLRRFSLLCLSLLAEAWSLPFSLACLVRSLLLVFLRAGAVSFQETLHFRVDSRLCRAVCGQPGANGGREKEKEEKGARQPPKKGHVKYDSEAEDDIPKKKELAGLKFACIGSTNPPRHALAKLVTSHGGIFQESLDKDTDLLLVSDDDWAAAKASQRYRDAQLAGVAIVRCSFVPALLSRKNVEPQVTLSEAKKALKKAELFAQASSLLPKVSELRTQKSNLIVVDST